MRILFVTSNRIGDAVLSTGLLDHLLKTYPNARFTIACGPVAEGLFARMPQLDATIVMEKRSYGRHWLPLWTATVGVMWDLVVDIRASAISYLVPTRRRAVMRKSAGHKTVQLARLLKLDPAPLPVVWTNPEDRAVAFRQLPSGSPIVALGPTANWTGKVWPAEKFAALFHALRSGPLPGARAAIFAGPGPQEAALAAPLLVALPDAINLTGKLDLPQVAACLARCALFVGNDSGLMHMAAASGAPTLGLFGPTSSAEYAPAGRCAAAVLSLTADMDDLTVEAAYQAVLRLL
jgi:heptosyltransferase-3